MDALVAVVKIEEYVESLRRFANQERDRLNDLVLTAHTRPEQELFARARDEYKHSVELLDTVLLGVKHVKKEVVR